MRTLLDDVLLKIKKTKYPFQKESDFEYWEDTTIMQDGRKLKEYVVKFPIAGTLLTYMPFYKDSGITIVEFPEWTDLNKRAYEYHDESSKYEAINSAIDLIIESEMEWI